MMVAFATKQHYSDSQVNFQKIHIFSFSPQYFMKHARTKDRLELFFPQVDTRLQLVNRARRTSHLKCPDSRSLKT
jgi:hypothetical protein